MYADIKTAKTGLVRSTPHAPRASPAASRPLHLTHCASAAAPRPLRLARCASPAAPRPLRLARAPLAARRSSPAAQREPLTVARSEPVFAKCVRLRVFCAQANMQLWRFILINDIKKEITLLLREGLLEWSDLLEARATRRLCQDTSHITHIRSRIVCCRHT